MSEEALGLSERASGGLSLAVARRALLRGLVGAVILALAARLALEVWFFHVASSAFALLYFTTLPASALPYVAAVVGAWLLPASLLEARAWDQLGPKRVVLLGFVVAALGILLATVQGAYTHGLVAEGAPGKALDHAFAQAREVLGLIPSFPRDASALLATFALPFPLVVWFRRGPLPRRKQLLSSLGLVSALTLALYVPLLPEPSTKVVGGDLVRVGRLEHLAGWWLLLLGYAGSLSLAAAAGDALDRAWEGWPAGPGGPPKPQIHNGLGGGGTPP